MGPFAATRFSWWRRVSAGLALAVLAGCASLPCADRDTDRRALRPTPAVPDHFLRADRALLAAFFQANGLRFSTNDARQVIAPTAPRGRMDRNALRRIARRQNRVVLVIEADRNLLWDELGRNHPLLVLFPSSSAYQPSATPVIPVAWDRAAHTLELLDGNGEIQSVPEDVFFARRAPLKQAALRLVTPGALRGIDLTREQQLLLADFWYHRGFYKRAGQAYQTADDNFPDTGDIDALLGRGNALFRRRRFQQAIPVFRAALALDPDNPAILNNLAYAMLNGDGELLTALRHAQKADKLDPGNPLILETIGSLELRIGDAARAAKTLELAWARALKHSPEVQIAIMDQLTRAWLGAGRDDLAWQVASHRRRTYPDFRMPRDILQNMPALRSIPPAQSP